MSTILKALQRLEDEKGANVERPLDEQIVAQQPPPDPDRRGLRIGAVAVGGLAILAAAFLFWPTREDPDAEVAMESLPLEAAPVATIAQEVAAEKPRRRPPARRVPAARAQQDSPEAEVASIVEVVKRLDAQPADSAAPAAASKRAAPIAKADAARPSRQPGALKPDTGVARGAAQPRPARKQVANAKPPATQISENSAPVKMAPAPPAPVEIAAVAPEPVSTEIAALAPKPAPTEIAALAPKPAPTEIAAVAPEPAPIEIAALAPEPAPIEIAALAPEPAPIEIAALAPKPVPTAAPTSIPDSIREPERKVVQRAKLPPLSVEKTIWHPDVDRRVAIVKLIGTEEVLRLKEGDAVGPLVVQAIKPGSVLFNHDGIEIQYNVGG